MESSLALPTLAAGRLRKLGRRLPRRAGGLARFVADAAHAEIDAARGRYEQAVLRYGALVRHVEEARESMLPYRRIAELAARGDLAEHRPDEQPPRQMVFFLGYSRSGHSLVGSLLDAHPQVVISHELHAVKHLRRGYPYSEVLRAMRINARFFHHFGRGYSGYDYRVAGQHQGRCEELVVLGDKKGNGTGRVLARHPELPEVLERVLPVPLCWIHVIRDPFDNIAARALRTGASLEQAADGYFSNARVIADLARRHPARVLDVHLDDLIADPRAVLSGLLGELGVSPDASPGYLDACAGVVFATPRRASRNVTWSEPLVRSIRAKLAEVPFLGRYRDIRGVIRGQT